MTFEKELTSLELLEKMSEARASYYDAVDDGRDVHEAYYLAFDEAQDRMIEVDKLHRQSEEASLKVKAAESLCNALRAEYEALVQLK